MDMDSMGTDPNAPVQTEKARMAEAKREKKLKPTRGGGGGFSR